MDQDNGWWGYVYPKNINKQHLPKLLIPRLTEKLGCGIDADGLFATDNVDVNGVIPKRRDDLYFLTAILNGPVANFVWRRISKPFQNNFMSANKQFIAPLPVPQATPQQCAEIAAAAQKLESMHSDLRSLYADAKKRLETCQWTEHQESLLWPELEAFKGRGVTTERLARLKELKERLKEALSVDGELLVVWKKGELSLHVGKAPVLDNLFLTESQGQLLAMAWRTAS